MTDAKNADITVVAVYNRLREIGDAIKIPLDDKDVDIIVKDSLKIIKAQEILRRRLVKAGLLK